MTNDQLSAFIAVVEQGSFRAAAAHIHKTQPTISAAVSVLEKQFGFLLFNRENYRPSLTSEGKTFYRKAKQLLAQAAELEALGHQLSKGAVKTLTLSLSAMCAMPPSLERIRRFCDRDSQLQLRISTQHLSGVLEQLRLEKADLAIGPHTGLDDRYEFVELTRITMITVARPDLVDGIQQGAIPASCIRDQPHILLSDSGSQAPFDHINVLPGGRRWYVSDYLVKKTLLLAGMGWSRMPLHVVEEELRDKRLVPIKIEGFCSRNQVPIYLIKLKNSPLSDLAKGLWGELLQLEEELGAIVSY